MNSKTNSKKIIAVLIVLIVVLVSAGITIVAYLLKVSVKIAGTNAYRNQMVLSGKTDDGKQASLRYQFKCLMKELLKQQAEKIR